MLVLWTDIVFGNDFADVELTTIVKSKTKECFYQFAESRYIMRFEYQVRLFLQLAFKFSLIVKIVLN